MNSGQGYSKGLSTNGLRTVPDRLLPRTSKCEATYGEVNQGTSILSPYVLLHAYANTINVFA